MRDRTKSWLMSFLVTAVAIPMIASPWLVGCRTPAPERPRYVIEIDCTHPDVTCAELDPSDGEQAEAVEVERVEGWNGVTP